MQEKSLVHTKMQLLSLCLPFLLDINTIFFFSRSKDYKYRKSKSREDRNDRNRDRSPREKYYKDKTRDKEVNKYY